MPRATITTLIKGQLPFTISKRRQVTQCSPTRSDKIRRDLVSSMATHLTFDIDWAPDWSIIECLEILAKSKTKATFFCTHATPLNEEIKRSGHNLGIHPNFLQGTTQGSSTTEIIANLLDLAPSATCMRTHALVQSSPLLHEIFSCFSQLKFDFSLLTPGIGLSKLIYWHFDNVKFHRINYQWEDDAFFWNKEYTWTSFMPESPNFVMDFHPIHVSLNSSSLANYQNLKSNLNGAMSRTSPKDCKKFINEKSGTRNALEYAISEFNCISFEDLLCELAS